MNFFKLYIGDYQRDTAHLSITEHGAYLLMMQHYYATEEPLPKGKALHRMLRAQDRAEREAIDAIAKKFWVETEEGLINPRADEEIAKASAQKSTNQRTAKAREEKRKRERQEHESCTIRQTNDQPNQTPDTRHQTPDPVASPLPHDDDGTPNQRASPVVVVSDWSPSRQITQDLRFLQGIPEDFVDFQASEFRTYHADAPPKSEAHWNAKFMIRCAEQWRRAQQKNCAGGAS